eukprot:364809-Chlamydomonas_euryale.AAC.2
MGRGGCREGALLQAGGCEAGSGRQEDEQHDLSGSTTRHMLQALCAPQRATALRVTVGITHRISVTK